MDMSKYLSCPLEIDKVCRACLGRKGDMRELFGACLDEMLMSFTSIHVKEGDGFPHLMCVQCVLQVSRAYTFKQLCEKSASTLKAFVSHEFQSLLADHQKATKSMELKESELAECSLITTVADVHSQDIIDIDNFEEMDISAELTLDVTGGEIKEESELDVLESTHFVTYSDCDEHSFDGELREDIKRESVVVTVKPDEVLHYGNHTVLALKSSAPSHMIEICPDGTAHLVPRHDLKDDSDLIANDHLKEITLPIYTTDMGGKYKCTKCNESFNMKVDLKLHMTVHPFENICGTCGKSFPEARALKRHLKTHLENKPHTCDICNKSFAESSNLNKHKKRHTGELRNVQGKPHLCSVCGRGFKWATSLAKHFKYHTGRKLLCCKYCAKQYVEARSLRIHMRSHTGEKPYICNICSKGFTQKCNLEKHIRVHTGEKPHICSVCGKGFSQRGYVTIHMRTHTGEKPYSCNICGKGFAGANTLTIHHRTHTGEKPFHCNTCGKLFSRQETLVVHQRTHTGEKPHICNVCEKGFASSGQLSGHMRSHTGVKPHACSFCNKRFAGSSSLKVHMRSHTGEKPYICDTCGKAFTQKSALAIHHSVHSGKNQTTRTMVIRAENEEVAARTSTIDWV